MLCKVYSVSCLNLRIAYLLVCLAPPAPAEHVAHLAAQDRAGKRKKHKVPQYVAHHSGQTTANNFSTLHWFVGISAFRPRRARLPKNVK